MMRASFLTSTVMICALPLGLFSCVLAQKVTTPALPTPTLSNVDLTLKPVSVFIDSNQVIGTSKFQLGVTHTQKSLDNIGMDTPAISRAKTLLSRINTFHNVHIMGWGADNPNPAPNVYDFDSLDRRMKMIRSIPGAIPVLTLCAAPDWMKGGEAGKTVWKNIEVAPKPEHYADFAKLAATIARRYPEVRYFQVWNEMKGLWKGEINNWDYEGYTKLYNLCYDELKAVNSNNKIGGPYLVIEGTGGGQGPFNDATNPPISPRNSQVIDYWLANKHGADFIVLDRAIKSYHDKNTYSVVEAMHLTRQFEQIAHQIRTKTDLPIWWGEYYGLQTAEQDPQTVAALHASILVHMIQGGSSVALLWQPMETGEISHFIITDARKPQGGRPTPYGDVFAAIHDYFGPDTPLLKAVSSAPEVQILASPERTLLINQSENPVLASVNGLPVALGRYDVRLILTPLAK